MRGWLLTLHLVGVIMWMGGFLVFARLLGYHATEPPSARPTLSRIEARLNYVVALPGLALALAGGVLSIRHYGLAWLRSALWLHVKLALVLVLVVAHAWATLRQRRLARMDPSEPVDRRGLRVLHAVLGLLLTAILALAVHQPMAK